MAVEPKARRGSIFLVDLSKRCEPSAHLFTRAVKFFLVNGYSLAKDIGAGEIILVNTCCVTQDKIATSRAGLEFARANGKGKRIVLFGCMASLPLPEPDREDLICVGPKNLDDLDTHFPHDTSIRSLSAPYLPPALYEPGQGLSHGDYFVLIAQGCSNGCSYCNIKRAKGEVRSESAETILREVRTGLSQGVREFSLLADDCASYGRDMGTDLTQLMDRLLMEGPGFGLKLGYVYPLFVLTHFDKLMALFSTGRIRYVNIPVQSGSQRLLDLMNRRYSVDAVMACVGRLRAAAPGTSFCTHIMINFPTESPDDFHASLDVAEGFDEVLFLHYSDNQGTAAAGVYPKVPEPEAHRRLDMASDFANRRKAGRSAVIKDFDCKVPYNLVEPAKG